MSNRFSTYIKKKVVRKNQNLVSLDEPFQVMEKLLKGQPITGILDAGASNASVSRRLLRHFSKAIVYGFEPNPLYIEQLKAFAVEEPRFSPQYFALSDREGTAELHLTESPGNTSLFKPAERLSDYDRHGAMVNRTETVQVVTIDDWAERNKAKLQLMKFDIQGGELKALQGAQRTLQETTLMIYTEVWFNSSYQGGAVFSEIDLFLRAQGFVLHELFQPKYHPKGTLLWGNAIYSHAERLAV